MMKKLSLVILLSAAVLLPGLASAATYPVTFPEAAYLYIQGRDDLLRVSAGSSADSITVGSPDENSLQITLSEGESITLASLSKYWMAANPSNTVTNSTCAATYAITLESATTQTIIVNVSGSICDQPAGGGTQPPSGTPTPSPSPSLSPTPSPSESPSPSPGASPSPSPSPTPGLVPVPPVSANPTPEEIQAAIAAILNNINYLQGQLLLLQEQQPFTQDLFYGLWNNSDVMRLQQFLIDKGYMVGPATGNFYTKTLAAVKAYQTAKGITPVSGYFGPLTRQAVNAELGF